MLGTVKTSGSHIGAQYIVKIFLCQTFCERICKKNKHDHLAGDCQLSAHFVRSKAQSAKRIAFGE
jgi:hypothetical protein